MKYTVILKKNSQDTFFSSLNFPVFNYYNVKVSNLFFRIVRKLFPCFLYLFFGNWKSQLSKIDTILLFDDGLCSEVFQYIKKKNSNIKVILWYWNPVNSYSKSFLKSHLIDEFYTYSKKDQEKYHLKYNTQFYTKSILCENRNLSYDVLFLGASKLRRDAILELEQQLKKKNVITNITIIQKKQDYVSYSQYLKMVGESKAILDYNDAFHDGLTLRVMEALFFHKKLITNNLDIVNYDFYRKSNIFVLGLDDFDKIQEFLNMPYEEVATNIIDYYDFDHWVERF